MDEWVRNGRYLVEMSIGEAADELGLDHTQLAFYFRFYEHTEFRIWRKRMRIEYACRLMKERPDLPLSSIGEYVGIPDRSNFRREFYEICGMFPSEWKEQNVR
ncbi:MAG: helix-turn-helix domain-containing protein [Bacteroidales bacterium]|nr:helix-turn-helix domain-containing protein [Bacteroidales bacterium]